MNEGAEPAGGRPDVIDLSRGQQTFARRVAESKATIPHLQMRATIEVPEPTPSLGALFVRACGLALREHPRLNASYRDGKLEVHSRVNVALAVAGREGEAPLLPTIADAHRKGLDQIASEIADLTTRARDGSLTAADVSGATLTVYDLSDRRITDFEAVIVPPQAVVLALGGADQGRITVTLGCDHRIVHGDDAAAFLERLGDLLATHSQLAG